MFDIPIPNCVPEYFREKFEREEHEADLLLERQEHYDANQKKMSTAYETGLPILDYGGYNTCQDCKNADHDTQISELDDFCSVICHDPDCLEHKKHKK